MTTVGSQTILSGAVAVDEAFTARKTESVGCQTTSDDQSPTVGLYRTSSLPFGSLGQTGINERLRSIDSLKGLSAENSFSSRVAERALPAPVRGENVYRDLEDDDGNESVETPVEPTSGEHIAATEWIAHVREVQRQEDSMNARGGSQNNLASSQELVQDSQGGVVANAKNALKASVLDCDVEGEEERPDSTSNGETTVGNSDVFDRILDYFRDRGNDSGEQGKSTAQDEVESSRARDSAIQQEPSQWLSGSLEARWGKHEPFAALSNGVSSRLESSGPQGKPYGEEAGVSGAPLRNSGKYVRASGEEPQSAKSIVATSRTGEVITEGYAAQTELATDGGECGETQRARLPASENEPEALERDSTLLARMSLIISTEIELALEKFKHRETTDDSQPRVEAKPAVAAAVDSQSSAVDFEEELVKNGELETPVEEAEPPTTSGAALWLRLKGMLEKINRDKATDG
ncbi:hypothetical protein FOZ61_005192 [Perkinsus olseni]|uniref:Uncharacterized protein n=1 Tax=Perkinsus olseni TaxID=32597 RepID=A0A7J6LHZ0_PEROL|nr:hypothetical protein FOZ61_005192 [Perkinsus olseni]KAF4674330.1 hypothetical protein FOL46_005304 [Perkinsus olseni]